MIENASELITPLATIAAGYVPLDQIQYVPTDVFVQYQYIQMLIDGVIAFAVGWFVKGYVDKRKTLKRLQAANDSAAKAGWREQE
jgi:uncharacterized membrane-anchored protein